MRCCTELTNGSNYERTSNVGSYRITFGRLWKEGCSLTVLPQRKQNIEPSQPHHYQRLGTEKDTLKSSYHAQSKIVWENLVKGSIAQEWIQFMETHYENRGYKKIKARDWAPKFIGALWEHTQRVWTFRNSIYHADINR
jgi:hypothetical protein